MEPTHSAFQPRGLRTRPPGRLLFYGLMGNSFCENTSRVYFYDMCTHLRYMHEFAVCIFLDVDTLIKDERISLIKRESKALASMAQQ